MCTSSSVLILAAFATATFSSVTVDHGDRFSSVYAPSTVNFNEIFTNSLTLPDETLTASTKDEDFHLSLPSQFVEFRPQKIDTTTTPTPPPPKYLLNSSYLKKDNTTDARNLTTTSTMSPPSSEAPQESSVKVIPIKKNYQRGVLDLLFPASRVKAFKGAFDTFRRILSHTFRKR